MAKSDKPQASADLVEVTVARGTIHTDAGKFGPGETCLVTPAEKACFIAAGFILADDAVVAEVVQDGQVKVEPDSGPNVTVSGN